MLAERVEQIRKTFGVEFVDYERQGRDVLISSGAGIALALMDIMPSVRYMLDIDGYRHRSIDWEALAVALSLARPTSIVMVGWFTIDKPHAFYQIKRGVIETPLHVYHGGEGVSLLDFLRSVTCYKSQ